MKKILNEWRRFLSELIVKGDGPIGDIIAYKGNVWFPENADDEMRREINIALDIEEDADWDEIWDLRDYIDDRSDILMGTIDNNRELRLYTLGSFKFDPRSSVLVKKIVKQFDLDGVSVEGGGEDDEERTSKYGIEGKVAEYMYHGTTSEYLRNVLRFGLVPGKSETNYEGIIHDDAVFFSSRFGEAQHHAVHTASKVGGDPVVVMLKVPDKSKLIPDYDVDIGAGDSGCYDYVCQKLRDNYKKYQTTMKGTSFSLSREFGIFGYEGRVPAKFLITYFIMMNADQEGDTEKMHYANKDDYTRATPEEAATYVETKENFGWGSLEEPDWDEEEEDEDW